MMKVYLSGGMRSGWQDNLVFNDEFKHIKFIDPRDNRPAAKTPDAYTLYDMTGVSLSNVVFAYLEKDNPSGFGLALEIGYGKASGAHIILVDEKNDRYTQILRSHADAVFETLDEAMEFLLLFSCLPWES